MRKHLATLLAILAVAVFVVGCGDDEGDGGTTVVGTFGSITIVYAEVEREPDIEFYADIMPDTYQAVLIDSAVFADSLCELDDDSYWCVYGDQHYQWAEYYNEADSLRYFSGDTVELKLYSGSNVVTARVTVLDYRGDSVKYVVPVLNDTVPVNNPIAIIWTKVANADWYGMSLYYRADSSGTRIYRWTYLATKDTAYTISNAQTQYNGYYDINIKAVTGPYPLTDNSNNISSSTIQGTMHCDTRSVSRRTYVGTGSPAPPGGGTNDQPTLASENLIKILTGREKAPEGSEVLVVPDRVSF